MENKKIKITIELEGETYRFIQDIKMYENLRHKLKKEGQFVNEEDIIKSAIYIFINNIQNFYKQNIIQVDDELGKPYKLKNRIKEMRKEQGLSQTDLSMLSGIDKSNLSLIENNHNQPAMDYFLRLWIALNCPPIEDIFYRQ